MALKGYVIGYVEGKEVFCVPADLGAWASWEQGTKLMRELWDKYPMQECWLDLRHTREE